MSAIYYTERGLDRDLPSISTEMPLHIVSFQELPVYGSLTRQVGFLLQRRLGLALGPGSSRRTPH
jgi:hypothetical protein